MELGLIVNSPTAQLGARASSSDRSPPIAFLIVWFVGWSIGGYMAFRQFRLRLRRDEIWRFERDQIIAEPNWQFTSTRRLKTGEREVHVRLAGSGRSSSLEFVSDGVSLNLGPFADEELFFKTGHTIRSYRPSWKWPGELLK